MWFKQNLEEIKEMRTYTEGVVPTLTAQMGTGGGNVPYVLPGEENLRIRKLTPLSASALKDYPTDGRSFIMMEEESQIPKDMRDAEEQSLSQLWKQLVENSMSSTNFSFDTIENFDEHIFAINTQLSHIDRGDM
jgi:hypothetical protein